jgi:hypothetical protein
MNLKPLTIRDQKIFRQFLGLFEHQLSAYAFENIYIWRVLFDIRWLIIKDCLCIFFKDKIGCFLYLPPLGKHVKASLIEKVFSIMDGLNSNKEISRIENIEEKEFPFYRDLGYELIDKPGEYLCRKKDLVQLRGQNFKSKRACCNYFSKHYDYEYSGFDLKYRDDCLRLYNLWMRQRQDKSQESVYQGMLKDSLSCLKILLDNYRDLDLVGRIVKVDKEVAAFSFGFKLKSDTFCVLYEITDLSVKGLAQFLFREFCSELKNYSYINIMDDSGLTNLKRVKLSYRPVKLIPAYIARRKNA